MTGGEERHQVWHDQAVDRSPNLFLRLEPGGRVRAWNPTAAALLGESLHGRAVADLFHLPEGAAWAPTLDRVRRGFSVGPLEPTCTGSSGTERSLLAWVYPAQGSSPSKVEEVIVEAIDITERAEHEREVLAAKVEAEAAARLKGTILNNLSHEIRTPLTAILGFTELLHDELEGQHREFIELIYTSGRRLMATLVSVLELARLDAGEWRNEARDLNLVLEVREVVRLLQPMARKRDLRLHMSARKARIMAFVDPGALNRIVNNLVSNALKYTLAGSVQVVVRDEADEAVIEVHDTGVGIGAAFLPSVFDEFAQEAHGHSQEREGAGLGLSITRRLVEQNGGRIEVRSTKGEGSVFTVRLPARGTPGPAEGRAVS